MTEYGPNICAFCDTPVLPPPTSYATGEIFAVCSENCLNNWVSAQLLLGHRYVRHVSHRATVDVKTKHSHVQWAAGFARNCFHTGVRDLPVAT